MKWKGEFGSMEQTFAGASGKNMQNKTCRVSNALRQSTLVSYQKCGNSCFEKRYECHCPMRKHTLKKRCLTWMVDVKASLTSGQDWTSMLALLFHDLSPYAQGPFTPDSQATVMVPTGWVWWQGSSRLPFCDPATAPPNEIYEVIGDHHPISILKMKNTWKHHQRCKCLIWS